MQQTYFFTECTPADGQLIHFGQSIGGDMAELPPYRPELVKFGRWQAEDGAIALPDLYSFSLTGKYGFCWRPAFGFVMIPAELEPIE